MGIKIHDQMSFIFIFFFEENNNTVWMWKLSPSVAAHLLTVDTKDYNWSVKNTFSFSIRKKNICTILNISFHLVLDDFLMFRGWSGQNLWNKMNIKKRWSLLHTIRKWQLTINRRNKRKNLSNNFRFWS